MTSSHSRVLKSLLLMCCLVGVLPCHAQQLLEKAGNEARAEAGLPPALSIFQMRHRGFTAAEGAPMRAAAIAQDREGYLWFTSKSGLYRFDGTRFDRSTSRLLPSQMLNGLMADDDGSLWVGYIYGGVSHIHGTRVTTYADGIPPGTAFAFARTPDGVLWVATTGGLARFVGGTWSPAADLGYGDGSLEDMSTSADGSLWVTSKGHVYVLRPDASRFVAVDMAQALTELRHLPADTAKQVPYLSMSPFVDSAGALWAGERSGIVRYRPRRRDTGTDGDLAIERFGSAQGLTDPMVSVFFEDRRSNVWVATALGVDQFRQSRLTPVDFGEPVLNPSVAVDRAGAVWVGSLWGVYRIDHAVHKLDEPAELISCTAIDRSGTVWMGGKGGLWRFEAGHASHVDLPPDADGAGTRVQAIASDGEGALWVAVNSYGLYRQKDGVWSKVDLVAGMSPQRLVRLLGDERGRLWIAFQDGRIAVEDAAHRTRVFGPAEGLSVGAATGLAVRGDRVLAGGEHGLAMLNGERFVPVASATEHVFDGISGIVLRASGEAWLQSDAGVVRVSAAEMARARQDASYAVKADVFGQDDGLVGMAEKVRPVPSIVEGGDGRLWISTNKGLAWVDPDTRPRQADTPSVEVTGLVADGRSYAADGHLELPPHTRNVQVSFTSPALSTPGQTMFRYRLDGDDGPWQDAGNRREAFFTNLGPGSYRLHVQVTNEDGRTSEKDAELSFEIQPAIYQTLWFKLLVAVLAGVVLVAAYRMRVAQLTAASRARHHERERIARELHDTLLQSVQGLLLAAQAVTHRPMAEETRRSLTRAVELARIAAIEGRDRVNALRLGDTPDACPLRELLEHPDRIAAAGGIAFTQDVRGTCRSLKIGPGRELVAVLREALLNVALHAKATEVHLSVRYGSLRLRVEVMDNGVGIAPVVLRHGGREGHWGIPGMRERIESIGGRMTLSSRKNGGPLLRLTIPARRIYRPAGPKVR